MGFLDTSEGKEIESQAGYWLWASSFLMMLSDKHLLIKSIDIILLQFTSHLIQTNFQYPHQVLNGLVFEPGFSLQVRKWILGCVWGGKGMQLSSASAPDKSDLKIVAVHVAVPNRHIVECFVYSLFNLHAYHTNQ